VNLEDDGEDEEDEDEEESRRMKIEAQERLDREQRIRAALTSFRVYDLCRQQADLAFGADWQEHESYRQAEAYTRLLGWLLVGVHVLQLVWPHVTCHGGLYAAPVVAWARGQETVGLPVLKEGHWLGIGPCVRGGKAVRGRVYGQLYRVYTSIFLHGSLLHLVNNLVGLHLLGSTVGHLFHPRTVVLIFLATAVWAGAAEVLLEAALGNYWSVGIGASGGVCGLMGALCAYARLYPSQGISKRIVAARNQLLLVNAAMIGVNSGAPAMLTGGDPMSLARFSESDGGKGRASVAVADHLIGLALGFLLGLLLHSGMNDRVARARAADKALRQELRAALSQAKQSLSEEDRRLGKDFMHAEVNRVSASLRAFRKIVLEMDKELKGPTELERKAFKAPGLHPRFSSAF
jgi:membrane associated rhomboid family serine protease